MAKATKTIRQALSYQSAHSSYFAATKDLFNQVAAMFRRAAIHAALGSAHSFYTHLEKWRKQKKKARARGKKFSIRPPVPPRSWNRNVTLYAPFSRSKARWLRPASLVEESNCTVLGRDSWDG